MTEQVVREDVEKLIQAPSTYTGVVAAGKRHLEAVGTADEATTCEALVGGFKEDVYSIDDLIVLTSSPNDEAVFNKEAATTTKTAAEAVRVDGEPNCLYDACQMGVRIL